ncbi:hypothetical protein ROHU_032261 [Labeo rohita]|uniref:Uncharacterized protein n=1 Tax=Labeo rohita TaxID=84645 RepID=A0A498LGY7_LABRO|nr:hypothetical protein ROHU_032261 [Labeo rohita]
MCPFRPPDIPGMSPICKAMELQIFQYDTFRRHCRSLPLYTLGKVNNKICSRGSNKWENIAIAADMRADSPGHSAKYGSYTVMHMESNTILDLQLVQSNEVGGSCYMEKEGLKRCLDLLESLSKKLQKLSKNKDCALLKRWQCSIRNHVYWCASLSTSGPEKVSNDEKKWFQAESLALHKVEKVLCNKRVLKDVEKLSHHFQTSSLEAFHSLIIRFTPKNVVFPFMGMLCRLYLAVLHHNENANREQATTSAGEAVYKMIFPKSKKGECTVRPLKTDPTYNYVEELLRLVFEEVIVDPTPFVSQLNTIPIPTDLSSEFERPSKEETAGRHVSRFTQEVDGSQHTDQPSLETPGVSGLQHRTESQLGHVDPSSPSTS